ncbi:iron-containing redox enzyme family protein [Thalassiella azotivora]
MTTARVAVDRSRDLLVDEDVQLALYLAYELHYGLDGADGGWEWSSDLLAARAVVEAAFEAALRRRFDADGPVDGGSAPGGSADDVAPEELPAALLRLATEGDGPVGGPVAAYVARHATLDQVRELMAMRTVYQLKEADPHTFAIPRLRGRAKAALVEIQADEYGGGHPDRVHAGLFARMLRALGLSDRPNDYLDLVPAPSLASVNAISLFALHHRLRGALCGHLAAFEATSSLPSGRMSAGLQRLGLGPDATEYFDEHVEADAVHEQVAAHDLCGSLVAAEPDLVPDVLLGARTCLGVDGLVGRLVLDAWESGATALRTPLPADTDADTDAGQPAGADADRLLGLAG